MLLFLESHTGIGSKDSRVYLENGLSLQNQLLGAGVDLSTIFHHCVQQLERPLTCCQLLLE